MRQSSGSLSEPPPPPSIRGALEAAKLFENYFITKMP